MYKRISICIMLIIFSVLVCNASISNAENATNVVKPVVQQATQVNDSVYGNYSALAWNAFHEDFNYSSGILNDYVKKNITRTQAMLLTMSVLSLTTQTAVDINAITPPEKYKKYQDYTVSTLVNFRMYLWYLGKFYETNDNRYAARARHYFNSTLKIQDMASQERLLHLMI